MNDAARNEMTAGEFLRFDLMSKCAEYRIPIYFFLGRHAYRMSSRIAEQYFRQIKAPYQKLEWFDNSGHAPCFEEPKKFNDLIARIVRNC
jgi:proline iminopeptidase